MFMFSKECIKAILALTRSTLKNLISFFSTCVVQQDFFSKLVDLFRMCEDLENMDGLYMIFKLVKGICEYWEPLLYINTFFMFNLFLMLTIVFFWWSVVLLNNPQIFDRIFVEEYILDIIGSLECRFSFSAPVFSLTIVFRSVYVFRWVEFDCIYAS